MDVVVVTDAPSTFEPVTIEDKKVTKGDSVHLSCFVDPQTTVTWRMKNDDSVTWRRESNLLFDVTEHVRTTSQDRLTFECTLEGKTLKTVDLLVRSKIMMKITFKTFNFFIF